MRLAFPAYAALKAWLRENESHRAAFEEPSPNWRLASDFPWPSPIGCRLGCGESLFRGGPDGRVSATAADPTLRDRAALPPPGLATPFFIFPRFRPPSLSARSLKQMSRSGNRYGSPVGGVHLADGRSSPGYAVRSAPRVGFGGLSGPALAALMSDAPAPRPKCLGRRSSRRAALPPATPRTARPLALTTSPTLRQLSRGSAVGNGYVHGAVRYE